MHLADEKLIFNEKTARDIRAVFLCLKVCLVQNSPNT